MDERILKLSILTNHLPKLKIEIENLIGKS